MTGSRVQQTCSPSAETVKEQRKLEDGDRPTRQGRHEREQSEAACGGAGSWRQRPGDRKAPKAFGHTPKTHWGQALHGKEGAGDSDGRNMLEAHKEGCRERSGSTTGNGRGALRRSNRNGALDGYIGGEAAQP